jgi:hypothetical protein
MSCWIAELNLTQRSHLSLFRVLIAPWPPLTISCFHSGSGVMLTLFWDEGTVCKRTICRRFRNSVTQIKISFTAGPLCKLKISGGPGSHPGQSVWDLRWTKALGQVFLEFSVFPYQCHSTAAVHTHVSSGGWTICPLAAVVWRQYHPIDINNKLQVMENIYMWYYSHTQQHISPRTLEDEDSKDLRIIHNTAHFYMMPSPQNRIIINITVHFTQILAERRNSRSFQPVDDNFVLSSPLWNCNFNFWMYYHHH